MVIQALQAHSYGAHHSLVTPAANILSLSLSCSTAARRHMIAATAASAASITTVLLPVLLPLQQLPVRWLLPQCPQHAPHNSTCMAAAEADQAM
jgi:hypothetical protein